MPRYNLDEIYKTYVWYCGLIGVQALKFKEWLKIRDVFHGYTRVIE